MGIKFDLVTYKVDVRDILSRRVTVSDEDYDYVLGRVVGVFGKDISDEMLARAKPTHLQEHY